MVIRPYLWIDQFVWARGFCGTIICYSASVDCSGTIQKIHMRKIRWRQGQRMYAIMTDFMIWGRLTRPRGAFRAQGSALTRNVARSHGSKNLLQRAILYRHKCISVSGKIAGQDQPKLYIKIWWLFVHISGLLNSFGLASFVVQENINLLQWIAAGSSGKSIWERLNETKVRAWW